MEPVYLEELLWDELEHAEVQKWRAATYMPPKVSSPLATSLSEPFKGVKETPSTSVEIVP